MKFGIFYELQLPRPWEAGDELKLYQNALAQLETADRLGYDHAWVVEQVMEIEVPDAVQALERTLAGLFAPPGEERRPRRESSIGD